MNQKNTCRIISVCLCGDHPIVATVNLESDQAFLLGAGSGSTSDDFRRVLELPGGKGRPIDLATA